MNNNDIEFELPPLPEGLVLEGIWTFPEDELILYRDACIQAAIASDRKRSSKAIENRFIEAESKAVISNQDYQYYLGLADAYDIAEQIINGEIDG